MSAIRQKAKEWTRLGLLFVGFISGIGLVVTCGGSGGSGQGGGTSTASTISFIPIDLGSAGTTSIGIPPALQGVTNVQDALNRLNSILSPELSKISDPFSPESVPDNQLPQIIVGQGEPLTFSRRLRGLVRSTNLSGPLRADNALLISCGSGQFRLLQLIPPPAGHLGVGGHARRLVQGSGLAEKLGTLLHLPLEQAHLSAQ